MHALHPSLAELGGDSTEMVGGFAVRFLLEIFVWGGAEPTRTCTDYIFAPTFFI